MNSLARSNAGVACSAAAILFVGSVVAQDYPARDFRSICNFAAGSGGDILVRYFSDRLAKLTERSVVVENKVGAQGNIGSDYVAKSKPDGYTIMITPASSTLAAAPHLFKSLPFDPLKDFTAVASIAKLTFVVTVDAAKPIRTIADLTQHLKSRPNDGLFGATNNSGMVSAMILRDASGLKTTHVPYKITSDMVNDMVRGEIDFVVTDSTWTFGQIKGGRVRALAVTSATRSSAMPDVPTMIEAGFAGFDVTPWWGVVVPAGTPKPIVDRLSVLFNQIATSEETKTFLQRTATDPFPGTAESMAALLKADHERWGRYVKLAKIEPQ
ncbi:MAG: Bug family tripartite tricarboxylate transporter substrate binding protein [Burkholderiales bacterium]